MPEGFQTVDWVFAAVALALVAMGLFRGFSGVVAFAAGAGAAAAASAYGWPYVVREVGTEWIRFALAGAAAIVVFGVVRIAVKKLVNGLLAQPTDAIAGVVVGAAVAAALLFAASRFEWTLERSLLAREVAARVG
jgi:hypothetical protein